MLTGNMRAYPSKHIFIHPTHTLDLIVFVSAIILAACAVGNNVILLQNRHRDGSQKAIAEGM